MTRNGTIALAAILAVVAFLLHGSGGRMSPTVDETHYAGVGKYLLERGDWTLKGAILHPPLSYYLNSVLLTSDVPESVWTASHQDERGRELFCIGPGDRVVTLVRLPIMAATLLLITIVFLEVRRRFDVVAAVIAAILIGLEPNILAHGALATQDLLLTLTLFWAVVRFRRFVEDGGRANLVIAGIALGLALLTKFTAILLLGILPVIAFAAGVRGKRLAGSGLVVIVSFAVLHLGYLPHYMAGESGTVLGKGILPGPFAAGIDFQRAANVGHQNYFMGEVSREGWITYYPVAFLAKTSIPFLLLAAFGKWSTLIRKERFREFIWQFGPPLALMLFFIIMARIQIGVRYLLPVYPFLAVAGGVVGAQIWRSRSRLRMVMPLLILWQIGGTALAYPHFLSYFNEAAGGSDGGMRILADSNLDWGQDLPGLRDYLDDNDYDGCYLAYFGNADPARYDIRYRYVPGWLWAPSREARKASLAYHPEPEIFAISRSVLQGFWLPEPDLFHWVKEYPKLTTIGGSIDIYDIGGDPSVHEKLAWIYRREGRSDFMQDELMVGMREENASTTGGE